MNYIAARQQIVYLTQSFTRDTHKLYGKRTTRRLQFSFSINIDDEQRKETDIQLEALNQRLRKKQITEVEAKNGGMTIINRSTEKLGVWFLCKIFFRQRWDWHQISQWPGHVHEDKLNPNTSRYNKFLRSSRGTLCANKNGVFYNLAHQLTQEIPSHSIKIIVGDFNPRLIEALPHETALDWRSCILYGKQFHSWSN